MDIAGQHITSFEEIAPGARAEVTTPITSELIRQFAELTRDGNPLHTDAAFASKTPFGRINMQGQLMSSLIVGVIGSKLPGAGWFCLGVNADFVEAGYGGDVVTAEVICRQKIDSLKVVVWDGFARRLADGKLLARAAVKTKCMF